MKPWFPWWYYALLVVAAITIAAVTDTLGFSAPLSLASTMGGGLAVAGIVRVFINRRA